LWVSGGYNDRQMDKFGQHLEEFGAVALSIAAISSSQQET